MSADDPHDPPTWRDVLGVVWTTEQRVEHAHGGRARVVVLRDLWTLLACGHLTYPRPYSARVTEGRDRAHCCGCALGHAPDREATDFTPAEARINRLNRTLARRSHLMSAESVAAAEREIDRLRAEALGITRLTGG